MTKFEFVLNKFYEITAWSLFAAVAMTVLNGDYDTVPAFHYFPVFVDEGKSRGTKAEPVFEKA